MEISVVIIAKNEADNLQLSLSRLGWCKDIVVVDDNSTDKTTAVATSFSARVFHRTFDGFGNQKRYAVEQAKNDWILNIDADEVLSDDLIDELKLLQESESITAYEIPIRHVFLGKIFRYGKESCYPHLRLFNKTFGNFNSELVHEKVETQGKTVLLKGVILHYSYKDLYHYFSKFNIYTDAGAKKLKSQGRSRSLLFCLLGFPLYFFKHYFIYRNFMNGSQGLIWSYLNAWYHTVKYLKLYELNRV